MPVLILAVCALAAAAQQPEDARDFLKRFASTARQVRSWKAEGVFEITAKPKIFESTAEQPHFQTLFLAPGHMRLEMPAGGKPVICSRATAQACLDTSSSTIIWPHLAWPGLVENLESAIFAGRDEAAGCDVIRAEYSKMPVTIAVPYKFTISPQERATRVLCFDSRRGWIVRDRVTASLREDPQDAPIVEVTVTAIFRDVRLGAVLTQDTFTTWAPQTAPKQTGVIHLPEPWNDPPPEESTAGALFDGYLTAVCVLESGEARIQRISVGDAEGDLQAFLEKGTPFQSTLVRHLEVNKSTRGSRIKRWAAVRYVVNSTIAWDQPPPAPKPLRLLINSDGLIQAIFLDESRP